MVFLVVKGLFRGFIREVASLAGIILGIWLGSQFQPQMMAFLKTVLPGTPFLSLVSFTLIFAIVLLLCNLMGWGFKTLLKKASLGWADKTLGTGLAVAKGVIIIYLLIILLTYIDLNTKCIHIYEISIDVNLYPRHINTYSRFVHIDCY